MKRSTNFKKFNLIERDELDRLRAKQIRDYSPVLSQLVTIKNEIDRVFGAPKLSPDDRVKILNLLHSRFDHIYKVLKYDGLAPLPPPAAGVLPIAAPAIPAAAAAPAGPLPAGVGGIPAGFIPVPIVAQQQMQLAPLPAGDAGGAVDEAGEPIPEEDALGLDAHLAGEPRGTDIADEAEQSSEPGSERGIGTEPTLIWPTKEEMGIMRNFVPKYTQLTSKLSRFPHLINRNNQNEIVLNGEAVAGSNFSDLIASLYRRNRKLNH